MNVTRSSILLLMLAACSSGGSSAPTAPRGPATLECPPPIGAVPREDCTEIADDFGALTVAGALKVAGNNAGEVRSSGAALTDARIDAIRAAGALANSLKEQRVNLCEAYDKCQVPAGEHARRDQALAEGMRSLIQLWNARSFAKPESIAKFRASVSDLDAKLNGTKPAAPPEPPPPEAAARSFAAGDVLDRTDDAGVTFKADGGALTIAAADDKAHDALRSNATKLALEQGKRLRVRVIGTFTPAVAALIAPGDEIGVKLKYRADDAGELFVALRSLEDADALESTSTWKVAAGEKGAHDATLTAAAQESGFFVGVGFRGGAIDLDDIELTRAGATIASARAESPAEALVKSVCAASKTKPIAGKASFHCPAQRAAGDVIAIGSPAGSLVLSIRTASGDKATIRTMSLEGGRSVDAMISEPSSLIVGLVGAGSATVRTIEVAEIGK